MAWQTPKTNWGAADGVRNTDFNRIEGNILELRNMSAMPSDITIYVSTSGNDTSGTGTSTSPFKTITHALSMIPRNMNGKTVTLDIATGTYTENVVVKGYNDGVITFSGAYGRTATLYSLTVDSSVLDIKTIAIRASYITVTNGATLLCNGAVTVGDAERGLYVNNGSRCRLYAQLSVSNTTISAIQVAGA